MGFIAIERGKDAGQRIEIKDYPVTIGRDRGNHIVIADPEASRHHFRIKRRGRLYILEDLESRNGTFVNGDRIVNRTIESGDKILVGTTELVFFAPDDDVHIATDLVSFDLKIDETVGIHGPIGLSLDHNRPQLKRAERLDPASLANNVMANEAAIKDVFNFHSNILVIRDLSECSSIILKSLGRVFTHAARGALFIWSEKSRSLIPYAQKTFKQEKTFRLSQKAFEDCLSRKQGIYLTAEKGSDDPRHRLVLPILHLDEIVAVTHLEFDGKGEAFKAAQVELAFALLQRASAILESMLLRKELDSWLLGIMDTIIYTIEAKDTYTRGHSERVSNYCMAIADELTLNREIKKLLMISSLCHDIGKIGIPDVILKKASMLALRNMLK